MTRLIVFLPLFQNYLRVQCNRQARLNGELNTSVDTDKIGDSQKHKLIQAKNADYKLFKTSLLIANR